MIWTLLLSDSEKNSEVASPTVHVDGFSSVPIYFPVFVSASKQVNKFHFLRIHTFSPSSHSFIKCIPSCFMMLFFICVIYLRCSESLSFPVHHFLRAVSGTAELMDSLVPGSFFCGKIIASLVSVHVQGNTAPPFVINDETSSP